MHVILSRCHHVIMLSCHVPSYHPDRFSAGIVAHTLLRVKHHQIPLVVIWKDEDDCELYLGPNHVHGDEYDKNINDVDIDELHLRSEHETKDDGGTDSDAHAQARQLDLVVKGGL